MFKFGQSLNTIRFEGGLEKAMKHHTRKAATLMNRLMGAVQTLGTQLNRLKTEPFILATVNMLGNELRVALNLAVGGRWKSQNSIVCVSGRCLW